MAPVRNVDDASIYLIQRGACGRVCHILHTGFHLPPALCYLRNMTFSRSSLFIFKLKLSYRLQTLLSTINFISDGNIFHNPYFITAVLHRGQKSWLASPSHFRRYGASFTLFYIQSRVLSILHFINIGAMEIRNHSISQNVKILISSDFTARFIFNIIQYLALQSIVCYSIHNPKLILPEMCY